MYGAWTKRLCGTVLAILLCLVPAGASGAGIADAAARETAGAFMNADAADADKAAHMPNAPRADKADATVMNADAANAAGMDADWDMPRRLVPVGHTVGMKLFSKGVMVVKLTGGDTPAKTCGLRTGDVIVACNHTPVTSAEQFQALLQEDTSTDLEVRRDGGEMVLRVEPERDETGVCSIGAWVRDSMAGIGTLTWYDPENGTFGALGHGVTDVDTALLMPFQDGAILPAKVKAVKKGEKGSAGELRGDFNLSVDLGRLYANTDRGVFGTLYNLNGAVPDGAAAQNNADAGTDAANTGANTLDADYMAMFRREAMETGDPVKGPARILANVSGDEVKSYEIEIIRTEPGEINGRELVISVTDPVLLERTGGIVQGMSGSPILQDGKFVGAVTHVLLQDPAKGYGISLKSMLAAA